MDVEHRHRVAGLFRYVVRCADRLFAGRFKNNERKPVTI
ncbi:hypothetical protein Cp87MAT_0546 [Corynebacterium pseudotuberculosis]|nr:hypothetical protein CpCap1W_0538 [Corynebacterium pseudotuberculosis]QBB92642.1 hypothetical protein CpCAPNAT1_00536 [Corynebacterium pseudotuberculosis]QBB94750.1 hypothetical protein CpCAPMI03_00537 [Corynebacterium pseudotuberculosis]QBB96865.1 hypothetical protein CpCAPMI05_00538 [Corynebacterium pseudotuberculosis]QBB98982.1 hypothetical protein Cp87MAT_0546 [Corynebacterium pseudotuberculosis]